jgi:CRP/FNR family cyclic AMP-dependent transcriptional regulator
MSLTSELQRDVAEPPWLRLASPARPSGWGGRPRDEPLLTEAERLTLHHDGWFAELPMVVRHDLLRHCSVKRLRDDVPLHAGQQGCIRLDAVASGAVRLGLRQPATATLEYLPAGTWFVDPGMFGGTEPLHLAAAHGPTTVVSVRGEVLSSLLRRHAGLEAALQRLNHARVAAQFGILEELATLPLSARLARCIRRLCDRFGHWEGDAIRIGVPLKQDALADLIHVSRQRVNLQLKTFEAAGIVRVQRNLLVLAPQELMKLAN